MPREELPPEGWSRIAHTSEHPPSLMAIYRLWGLEYFQFDGMEWPPRVPLAPDIIAYADVRTADMAPPPDPSIPPQALSQPFTLPIPSLSFPDLAMAGDLFGPARLVIEVYRLSGGRKLLASNRFNALSNQLGNLSRQIAIKVGSEDLTIMKELLGGAKSAYDLEVVVAVECAQPFRKAGIPPWAKADWFWVKTVQRTFTLSYPILAPQLTKIKEIDTLRDDTGKILKDMERQRDDFMAEAGKLISTLSQYRVNLPALSQFYVDQGIKDALTGYITRVDLEGIIQGMQMGTLAEVEALWGQRFADIAQEGTALRELLNGQIYAMRQDFEVLDTRVSQQLETLFSLIKPLQTAIGEQLTRKDVEDIVGKAIEKLRADLIPPVPIAAITATILAPLVGKTGDTVPATLYINALQPGLYRVPGYVTERRLPVGAQFFSVSFSAGAVGMNFKEFLLHAKAPDGSWHRIGSSTVQYSVTALAAPLTDEPPDYRLYWQAPPGIPGDPIAAGAPTFSLVSPGLVLIHSLQFPGAGWGFGFECTVLALSLALRGRFLWLNASPPGGWSVNPSWLGTLYANSLSLPARDQKITFRVKTFIHDSAGNIYKEKIHPDMDIPFQVKYPEPKFGTALKPPAEAPPGLQFPMMVAWENQTGVAGLVRVGGYEVLAPPGPSILPLFGTFPENEVDSALVDIPLEVKGPGGVWEKVDAVSFKVFRLPVQAKITKLEIPEAAKPGAKLSVPVECSLQGVPKDGSVPIRLVLGSTVLAEGTAKGDGGFALSPRELEMPASPLAGNAELQVYDKSRGESKRWIASDVRYLRVDALKPLPIMVLSAPAVIPAGEPVPVAMTLTNLGDSGRVKGSFLQKGIMDKEMTPREVANYDLTLGAGLWDDSHLGGRVQVPVGGGEEGGFSLLVRVVFPQSNLRYVEAPQYARAGTEFTVAVELWNSGDLGTIGAVIAGEDQSAKVGGGSGIDFRRKYSMPASPQLAIPIQTYHLGRLAARIFGPESLVAVEVKETAFISGESFVLYGAPGMSVTGVIQGRDLEARGWDDFPDGPAPPVTVFKKSFHTFSLAEFTGGVDFLYLAITPDSAVKDFAVVEGGRLVESAAERYISSGVSRGASMLLNLERAFTLPPLLRLATQAIGTRIAQKHLKSAN